MNNRNKTKLLRQIKLKQIAKICAVMFEMNHSAVWHLQIYLRVELNSHDLPHPQTGSEHYPQVRGGCEINNR